MKQHLLILITACFVWQCKSPSVPPAPTPAPGQTKTEMLTAKEWKLTAATVNPAYDYFGQQRRITDIYAWLAPCAKDDLYRYTLPNLLTISDGPQVCGGFASAGSFKWVFNTDETELTQFFSPISPDKTYTIETLSSDKLVLVERKTISGDVYTFKFEYSKQ